MPAFGDAAVPAAGPDPPPAELETQSASCWISLAESEPENDGIPPPPEATCAATAALDGLRASRFGPTVPDELAALSVWQPPQPACDQRPGPLAAPAAAGVTRPRTMTAHNGTRFTLDSFARFPRPWEPEMSRG
jgi:hypothetical protein